MKKQAICCLLMSLLLILVGCQKMSTNPYELKKEVRQNLTPKEQEKFITMYQSLEDLVIHLNDEAVSYEEDMELLMTFYEQIPTEWKWEDEETPMDLCWFYISAIMDGLMGCENYDTYADCKDAIDEAGAKLSDLFTQTYDRRSSVLIDENRFYKLYTFGKEKIE